MSMSEKKRYLLAALGLATLTLAAFALVWPFNAAPGDDWSYLYHTQMGDWDLVIHNRQFNFMGSILTDQILPHRAQGFHYSHLVSIFLTSLGLFHLIRRLLPWHIGLAFLVAAVYVVYVPFNYDQARALYIQLYTWALFITAGACVCLTEFYFQRGWKKALAILLALPLAYISIRLYESLIPIIGFMPILLWGYTRHPIKRPFVVGMLLYGAVSLFATLQFLIPFLTQDETSGYQARFRTTSNPSSFAQSTVDFYRNSFPMQSSVWQPEFSYLLPRLGFVGIACLLVWVFWRMEQLPNPKTWLIMILLGGVFVFLGGGAFVYAGQTPALRSYFFAAPGQALVVAGILGLLAHLLTTRLKIRYAIVLLCAAFFFIAYGWYVDAQAWAVYRHGMAWDEKNIFFRQMSAQIPDVESGTAILYRCEYPQADYQTARQVDMFAAYYLYFDAGDVDMPLMQFRTDPEFGRFEFTEQGLIYNVKFTNTPDKTFYTYDEMIFISCEGKNIVILDQFPAELAPEGTDLSAYNPYARIRGGFISPANAQILAR